MSDGVKFGWVVICLCIAGIRLAVCRFGRGEREGGSRKPDRAVLADRLLLFLAMAATVAADFFMLLKRENLQGLCCFLAVQLLYFLRLGRGMRELLFQGLAAGAVLGLCAAAALRLGAEGSLAVIYITLFAGNLFCCGRKSRGEEKGERRFLLGLILFFLCDIHVGLMNLGRYAVMGELYREVVYPWSEKALWFFYLPSQLLISFSNCNRIIEKYFLQRKLSPPSEESRL